MATFEFTFSEDHLIEATRRRRRCQRLGGRLPYILLVAALSIMVAISLGAGDRWFAAVVAACGAVILLTVRRVGEHFARRAFRKLPFHNERVVTSLSPEGFSSRSASGKVQCPWSSFTATHRFADGWVLEQGAVMYWLPVAALTEGTPAEVDDLLRQLDGKSR